MKVIIDTNVIVSAVLKDRIPEEVILFVLAKPEFTWTASTEIIDEYVTNPSCDLPKEVNTASEHKKSDFDFKTFGSDGMNRFWQ